MKLLLMTVVVLVCVVGPVSAERSAFNSSWPDLKRPVVRSADGAEHLAGQVIVKLNSNLRGRLRLSNNDGIARFGVAGLDELCQKWHVTLIAPAWRRPNPDPIALKYGCDLVFLIQFDAAQDIAPVARDFATRAEVAYACPNGYLRLDENPNDSLFSRQWHFVNLGAALAWAVAKGRARVVACPLDDGLDFYHPDIEANLWLNTPEDLNGNGRFDTLAAPAGDIDGVDQDGNGYADDVIGWDFLYGDPIPMPDGLDTHGTHCWGITNAVTNNTNGVAGAAWNCRAMAVHCGSGGGINIYSAIAAIYYAVPLGVWSFSMSFGSSSPYQPMADACQYAWDSGCVLFGSAGNDGGEFIRYPACYDGVENVAASRANDMKPSWSNYGPWVDVTAPGEAIWSTVTRGNGSYSTMDGTSMSAPLAAGVACWIKCFDTTVSNATCIQMLHDACDPMPDTLFLLGKLGAGRVSMANVILPRYYCNLQLTDWRFRDPNGNGRPDPGETASLIVTYSNPTGWRNATNVSATLATTCPDVTILKDHATFPDIPAGSSGNCANDSFVIQVSAQSPPRRIQFDLTVAADPDPAYPDTSFTVVSGEPRVLIVDDDLGQNYERYYFAACDSHGVLYHTWTVQTAGSPSAETLRHYPVVIWFTGDDSTTTLTATDQANLTSFLTNGGKLFISGQNIAQDLATDGFLDEYLHAQLVDDSTGKPYLPGIPLDPLTRGDTMVTAGGGGANNAKSSDGIRPVGGALGCAYFKDYGDTSVVALVRYSGTYQLVFMSVSFEAVDHSSRYLQKWTLLKRILEYFGERLPGVEEERPPIGDKRPYLLHITPSPFGRQALVQFIAPVSGPVELRTYTLAGRLVDRQSRTVVMGQREQFLLDGTRLANGVYLVQLWTPEMAIAQKTAVLK